MNINENFKNIENNTSTYEICPKSVPDGSCSCFFCEDREQDKQEYPRP